MHHQELLATTIPIKSYVSSPTIQVLKMINNTNGSCSIILLTALVQRLLYADDSFQRNLRQQSIWLNDFNIVAVFKCHFLVTQRLRLTTVKLTMMHWHITIANFPRLPTTISNTDSGKRDFSRHFLTFQKLTSRKPYILETLQVNSSAVKCNKLYVQGQSWRRLLISQRRSVATVL